MRTKLIVLFVALALGLGAALLANNYLQDARQRLEADATPVEVLMATEDIPVGTTAEEIVDRKLVEPVSVPSAYVSEDVISKTNAIDGMVLAGPISKGEMVALGRFALPVDAGLSHTVPDGYVAVSLPAAGVRGLSGLLRPGDFVAVMGTFEPDGGLEEARTKIVLRKARVLAIDRNVTPGTTGSGAPAQEGGGGVLGGGSESSAVVEPGSITLALTPAEAEKLVFSQEEGKVWLALIASSATEVPATTGQVYSSVIK